MRRGQIVLALGHSGAGKTFLARTASGFSLITDDKVALARVGDGRFAAWEHAPSSRIVTGRIAAVFLIGRTRRVHLKPLSQLGAAWALLKLYLNAAGFAGIGQPSTARSVPLIWELARSVPCAVVENDMRSPLWPMLEEFLSKRATSPSRGYWAYFGSSMNPSLRAGDLLVCKSDKPPRRGCVVIFGGARGVAVAHRLVGARSDGTITTRGDAHLRNDRRPVRPQDVLGVVTAVMRDGHVIPLSPANPELIRLRLLARTAWRKLRSFLGLSPRPGT